MHAETDDKTFHLRSYGRLPQSRFDEITFSSTSSERVAKMKLKVKFVQPDNMLKVRLANVHFRVFEYHIDLDHKFGSVSYAQVFYNHAQYLKIKEQQKQETETKSWTTYEVARLK